MKRDADSFLHVAEAGTPEAVAGMLLQQLLTERRTNVWLSLRDGQPDVFDLDRRESVVPGRYADPRPFAGSPLAAEFVGWLHRKAGLPPGRHFRMFPTRFMPPDTYAFVTCCAVGDTDTLLHVAYDVPIRQWLWRDALQHTLPKLGMRLAGCLVAVGLYLALDWYWLRKFCAAAVAFVLGLLGHHASISDAAGQIAVGTALVTIDVDRRCTMVDLALLLAVLRWHNWRSLMANAGWWILVTTVLLGVNIIRIAVAALGAEAGYPWFWVHDLPYVLLYGGILVGAGTHTVLSDDAPLDYRLRRIRKRRSRRAKDRRVGDSGGA